MGVEERQDILGAGSRVVKQKVSRTEGVQGALLCIVFIHACRGLQGSGYMASEFGDISLHVVHEKKKRRQYCSKSVVFGCSLLAPDSSLLPVSGLP